MKNKLTQSAHKIIVDSLMSKVKFVKEKLNDPRLEKGLEMKLYSMDFTKLVIIDKAFNMIITFLRLEEVKEEEEPK